MPLSGAERTKKYIEKLKADGKFEEYKLKRILIAKKCRANKKEKLESLSPRVFVKETNEIRQNTKNRVQKSRDNQKSFNKDSLEDKKSAKQTCLKKSEKERQLKKISDRKHRQNCEKVRQQTKIRVRKHRELKMSSKTCNESSDVGFTTKSAARKAISRGEKGLPKSLEKRKFVVKKIYEKYFDVPKAGPIPRKTQLDSSVKDAVRSFYERPEISQQAPGRKDYVNVKDAQGKKTKVQKKYLMFPIMQVYENFCKEMGSVPLKSSKFFELRPKHVMTADKTPHNMCLCIYHANFNNTMKAFRNALPDMPDADALYETFFCEPMTEDCYFGKCKSCKGVFADTLLGIASQNKNLTAKWSVWKKIGQRWQPEEENGTLEDLAKYIVGISDHFFKHHHINEEQLKSYRLSVAAVKNDKKTAVIQIDFAENYKCVFQDEGGNAHWNQSQVSIFTAAMWTSAGMNSFSVVSDDQDHSKRSIIPFVDRLFEELPEGIETVHIWSDGPTSQFKNKFIASALKFLQRKHEMKLHWSFFCALHGKGPVDGVGGSLKRQVWTEVKTRKSVVCNALDFSNAVDENSKIKVKFFENHICPIR